MTELEHIEIEGFKGLEHVEFEPTDINLITGRNNTGKTSFLEAVDLLFNPENLTQFDDKVDTVVNINQKSCKMNGKSTNKEFEILLREPSDEEVVPYFSDGVVDMMEKIRSFLSSFEGVDPNDASDIFSLREPIQRKLREELSLEKLSKLKGQILVVEINGVDYPYFLSIENGSEEMSIVYDELQRRFLDKFGANEADIPGDLPSVLDNFGESDEKYKYKFSSLVKEFNQSYNGGFLKEPENRGTTEFIESTELTDDIERTDDEQEPIKIDDIGDYITDTGLVANLKTFTLDYLVFEEDGKKHQIPYEFMGDGFKSIVGLLWALMDDEIEDKIVLLEEPETHMHPGYIREVVYFLINLAREEDVQLFITTHDSDFINDFFTENLTDEEEAYLEEEFSLLRMEEDSAVVEDYQTARENLKDLHLDLRGI